MAGTNKRVAAVLGGPVVVLVEPQLGENIGMVARAMLNCGLTDLRLVSPRDGWPNPTAVAAAAGAADVLDGAALFETAAEAGWPRSLEVPVEVAEQPVGPVLVAHQHVRITVAVHVGDGQGVGVA